MPADRTVRYGTHPAQFAEVWTPRGTARRRPVVLVHGGWWRARFTLSLMDALAEDLAARGHLVWNLEFRRTGSATDGGGWPTTFDDVLAALAAARESGVALDHAVAIGHSAGGHLALLAASVARLGGVVAQAPVTDLQSCAEAGLGEGATPVFLGGSPEDRGPAYRAASPLHRVPLGVPVLVVHGSEDDRVPAVQSRVYVQQARTAGDTVDLMELPGADHFFVLDPEHPSWARVLSWIDALPGGVGAEPS